MSPNASGMTVPDASLLTMTAPRSLSLSQSAYMSEILTPITRTPISSSTAPSAYQYQRCHQCLSPGFIQRFQNFDMSPLTKSLRRKAVQRTGRPTIWRTCAAQIFARPGSSGINGNIHDMPPHPDDKHQGPAITIPLERTAETIHATRKNQG